jgi:hypothetical protein
MIDTRNPDLGEAPVLHPFPSPFPPPKARLRRCVGLVLHRRGVQSHHALLRQAAKLADASKFNMQRAVLDMLRQGQLVRKGDVYDIPDAVRADYARLTEDELQLEKKEARAKPSLVPPRQAWPFRPLSARHIPSLRGPRDCEAREFHPVSMSSRVRVPFDGKGEA